MRVTSIVMAACLAFVTLQFYGATADAAATAAVAQAQPGQQEFVPLKDLPPEEKLPAAPLLVSAYMVVWVALMGYVWSIWRRLGKVESELADVSRRAAAKQGRA